MAEGAEKENAEETCDPYQMNDKQQIKKGGLPEKVLEARASLLTEFLKKKDLQMVRNLFIACAIPLFVSDFLLEVHNQNSNKSTILFFQRSFQKLDVAILFWILHLLTTIVAFFCFNFWATVRCFLLPKPLPVTIWDKTCILFLITYYTLSYCVLAKCIVEYEIPGGSTCVLVLDASRQLMKVHAFVRSSAPTVLKYEPTKEKNVPQKTFSKYLYFLFAPTLIYKDEYPRTKQIRWTYVLRCMLEVVTIIYICGIFCLRFIIPPFENLGKRKYTFLELFIIISTTSPIALIVSFCFFYCVLHCWQNAFAEFLMFGDRLFYKDWWKSTTYSRYYRTWNVVVHDWLYTYVYKDFYDYVLPNRIVARLVVIVLSALVHEYIITLSLMEFFPILFVQYVFIGFPLSFVRFPDNNIWNIVFLYNYSLGFGLLLSLYTIEKQARINCPVEYKTLTDFFTPRVFTCDCFE